MYLKKEVTTEDIKPWGGAKDFWAHLTTEERENVVRYVEESNEDLGDVWTETQFNDFLWFDQEFIAEVLLDTTIEEIDKREI